MTTENEYFELEDSWPIGLRFVIGITIVTIGPILIPMILSTFINPNFMMIIVVIIIFVVMLLFIPKLINQYKIHAPIHRVKFYISQKKIALFVQNKIYKEFIWEDILRIEVRNEKRLGSLSSEKNNFKLTIITREGSKDIRLFLFGFRRDSTRAILDSLETYSKQLDIEYKRLLMGDAVNKRELYKMYDVQLKEQREIEVFRKKVGDESSLTNK